MTIIESITDASGIPDNRKVVLLFYADWHEACVSGGPIDQILSALSSSSSSTTSSNGNSNSSDNLLFGKCNVDENPTLVEEMEITAVPTFCLINGGMNHVSRIVFGGDNVAAITSAVQRLRTTSISTPSTQQQIDATPKTTIDDETTRLNRRLDHLIRSSEVMIFMKGTPTHPRCGFSRQVIEIFGKEQISIGTFDILSDESVRQGLKVYSDWPTYPQIYVKGELIGGLDIIKEMLEDGTPLAEQLGIDPRSVNNSITNENGSNSSIGNGSGNDASIDINERLKQLINRSHIMLFMKGVPSLPKCGFSNQIVQILNELQVSYDTFDILSDELVRQQLKIYSNWPTYPQLYVNGELIGGLDIVQEMHDDGTLQDALK